MDGIDSLLPITGNRRRLTTSPSAGKATMPWSFPVESGEVEFRSSQGHLVGRGDVGTGADLEVSAA